MSQEIDADAYTRPFSLTKTVRRDPYSAILPSNPINSQKGKIILITGGGTGIGAAAAQVWARASATGIIIAGRRVEKLEDTASKIKEINSETKVLVVKADVSIDNDVKNLFHQTKETFDRVPDLILLCSAMLEPSKLVHETPTDEWWSYVAINAKGSYSGIYHYINSQDDPANPTGTVVVMGSASTAILDIHHPANGVGKLAAQRLVEFVDGSYPTLRIFSLMPGIVDTPSQAKQNLPYARDDPEMAGMLTLYLSQSRADYLRGSMMSVNWDVEELEQFQNEIKEKNLLKLSWIPILPISGGKGLPM